MVPSTGKLFHHKIKLPHLTEDSSIEDEVDKVKKSHSQYFHKDKITESQITGNNIKLQGHEFKFLRYLWRCGVKEGVIIQALNPVPHTTLKLIKYSFINTITLNITLLSLFKC